MAAPVSDCSVWRRVEQGEPEAIETLVGRYELHLLNYLYRVSGDAALAEHLFEQVMIDAVRRLIEGESSENHKLRIFSLARQALRDWLADAQQDAFEVPASAENEQTPVARALAGLTLERREAVVLKLFHKFSFEELASLLGTTAAQARYEVDLGLSRLSEALL